MAARELLRRRAARASLIAFTEYTLPAYRTAAHHKRIADALERVERGETKRLMIFMPPRHGKALALNTPIPTPSGWKHIGELRVGDQVFSDTGDVCNVVAVSEVWRDRTVYEVSTDDGDAVIADEAHEWVVRLCRKHNARTVRSTRYLAERTSLRAPMVDAAGPLKLPERTLPVDPYVLGVWLGDGRTDTAAMCSADQEIVDQVIAAEGVGGTMYRAVGKTQHFRPGPSFREPGVKASDTLQARLRFLGVLGNKHIPAQYLRASIAQRRALLQGLVDTDGYVSEQGQIEFCSTVRALAEGVRELVASLGGKASLLEGRATLNGRDFGPKYRVMFYMEGAARLGRKAVRTRSGIRANRRYLRIKPAGRADTVCIEVDSPSHMFLCGRSMLPTHNSELASKRFPAWYMGRNPNKQMIAASYNSELASDFGREVRNIVAAPEYGVLFDTRLADDSQAANRWHTQEGGSYVAAGVGSAITGRGANVLLIDDPLKDRAEADSERTRDAVWDWYTSTAYTRLMPGGAIVLIQTRWHEDDLAGRLLESGAERWEVVSMPALSATGEALWPEWYDADRLNQIKSVIGARDWNALYQQDPMPDGGAYFQREWIRYYDELPQHVTWYGASDYAVTDGDNDYTVHATAAVDTEHNLYIVDLWRGQTTSDVWVEAAIDLMAQREPLEWAEEQGQIIKSVGPFLSRRMDERGVYCYRKPYVSATDKATRARSIQARMSMGKVYLPRRAPWLADFEKELLRFPNGKNDDQVDVLSLFGRMLDSMIQAVVPKSAEAKRWPHQQTFDELVRAQRARRLAEA